MFLVSMCRGREGEVIEEEFPEVGGATAVEVGVGPGVDVL